MKNKNLVNSSPRTLVRVQIFVLFILGVLMYGNTIFHDYALDDMLMIYENKYTTQGVSGIGKILTTDSFEGFFGENKNLLTGGRFRPLTQVMFALEWELFGCNPFIGHFVNILLYSMLGLVIFNVLNHLFQHVEYSTRTWLNLPFVATALFITHPIHTEVVANIKGRDEILVAILLFLSLLYSIYYAEKGKLKDLIGVFLLFLLALFSKENAITFIAVIPISLFIYKKTEIKRILMSFSVLLMAAFVYLFYRWQFGLLNFGIEEKELLNNPYINASFSEKYATIFYTLIKYIQLLIFPHPLTHDYYPNQIPIINWFDIRAILSLVIYGAIIFIAFMGIIKKNIWGWMAIFYLATISISSNIFLNVGTFMNERFVFISSLAYTVLLAYILVEFVCKKNKYYRLISIVFVVVLFGYGCKTISRNKAWKDDFTLFTTDVKISNNSAKVNISAGGIYLERYNKEINLYEKDRLLKQAMKYIEKGLQIYPGYLAGWVLYGNSYLYGGQYKEAMYCYEKVLNIAPSNFDAQNNLYHIASVTRKKDLFDISEDAYLFLQEKYPDKTDYYFEYAILLDDKGEWNLALGILNNVIDKSPNYYRAYNIKAQIYGKRLNKIEEAIKLLEKANSINNKDASVWENLGVAYGIKGAYRLSLNAFFEALKIKPDNIQTYNNISCTYKLLGDYKNAEKYREKAVQFNK